MSDLQLSPASDSDPPSPSRLLISLVTSTTTLEHLTKQPTGGACNRRERAYLVLQLDRNGNRGVGELDGSGVPKGWPGWELAGKAWSAIGIKI